MTGAVISLAAMVLGFGVLVTMPIWAGWWKPSLPKLHGKRRGRRRLLR